MFMTKTNTNIKEIRVEEVHDNEEGKHFFRVYFYTHQPHDVKYPDYKFQLQFFLLFEV